MRVIFIPLGLVILSFIFLPLFKLIASSADATLFDTLLEDEVRSDIGLSLYAALSVTGGGFPLSRFTMARNIFVGDISRGEDGYAYSSLMTNDTNKVPTRLRGCPS
jgi:hypothetical protein